jgi:Kef-type K+ transport system membrane component KefB
LTGAEGYTGVMDVHLALLTLGCLLLVGLCADGIGRRTRLPRVTLLIVFGIAIGPAGFDLLPMGSQGWYPFLSTIALTMVAFLLGGHLSVRALRRNGREILAVSVTAVVLTAGLVAGGLLAFGVPAPLALILAAIATATAPAAVQDVVNQTGARGPFTDSLLGIVAVDDAWGLMVFSLLLVMAKILAGQGADGILISAMWEIGAALAVGAIVGLPAAFLTGRLKPGEPMQSEALGLVMLCAGLALWLEVSFLLAGMAAGAFVANLARHHKRAFHEVEYIEWPFMVLFFVLAGAALHVESIAEIGWIGLVYILLRGAGRLAGGWLGCTLASAPQPHRVWMGPALMPQAGVALGMALVAADSFPKYADALLAIAIGTTVIFELFGPLLTQMALRKTGEAR